MVVGVALEATLFAVSKLSTGIALPTVEVTLRFYSTVPARD